MQGLAAGHEQADRRAAPQQRVCQLGTRLDEVLAVVQQEQHLTVCQVRDQYVEQRAIRLRSPSVTVAPGSPRAKCAVSGLSSKRSYSPVRRYDSPNLPRTAPHRVLAESRAGQS